MFRSVLKGIFALWALITAAVVTAVTLGAAQKSFILQLITTQSDSTAHTAYQHILIDYNTRLSVEFPIANLEVSGGFVRSNNPQPVLILPNSQVINPDENQRFRRQTRHTVDLYDIERRTTVRLLTFTERWHRPTPTSRLAFTDSAQRFTQLSPSSANQPYIVLYNGTTGKLDVFDSQDDYRHLVTVPVGLPGDNQFFASSMSLSPDSSQIAVRFQADTLLVMNIDGSNRRIFEVGAEDFYTLWSDDSRYLLIGQYTTRFDNLPLKVLDVEAGTWREDLAQIIGRYPFFTCKGKWLQYSTYEESPGLTGYHMLHLESGRVVHIPKEALQEELGEGYSALSPDCIHMLITGNRTTIDTLVPPPTIYTLYISNFDFSGLHKIDDEVVSSPFWQIENRRIRYQVMRDDNMTSIVEKPIDNGEQRLVIGHAPLDMPYVSHFSFRHHVAIYIEDQGSTTASGQSLLAPTTRLLAVNLRNGQREPLYETSARVLDMSIVYDDGE